MIVRKHLTPNGELLLAVCDTELLGQHFEEGEFQLDCSSDFYKGDELSKEDLLALLKHCIIANVVGRESIGVLLEAGLVKASAVKTIAAIPYAHVVKIAEE
jgi:hypothetical protein